MLWRRYTLWQQAQFADNQFELNERTTTAVEIHDGQINTTAVLAKQQLEDTVTAVQQVDTKTQFPLQINRQDWLIILLAIVLLLAALILPNTQEAILQEQRDLKQSIEDQIQELERSLGDDAKTTASPQKRYKKPKRRKK